MVSKNHVDAITYGEIGRIKGRISRINSTIQNGFFICAVFFSKPGVAVANLMFAESSSGRDNVMDSFQTSITTENREESVEQINRKISEWEKKTWTTR